MNTNELLEASKRLSQAAPNTWQEFVKAFELHDALKRIELVQSPLDRLQISQGRAQETTAILKIFLQATGAGTATAHK